mmetsp:Transcript_61608/g.194218  ORF Transcript_61608/g.194218 Transcript_61608/m.194218 type:complete len:364 (-) Transcript_61608:152-1243(-)
MCATQGHGHGAHSGEASEVAHAAEVDEGAVQENGADARPVLLLLLQQRYLVMHSGGHHVEHDKGRNDDEEQEDAQAGAEGKVGSGDHGQGEEQRNADAASGPRQLPRHREGLKPGCGHVHCEGQEDEASEQRDVEDKPDCQGVPKARRCDLLEDVIKIPRSVVELEDLRREHTRAATSNQITAAADLAAGQALVLLREHLPSLFGRLDQVLPLLILIDPAQATCDQAEGRKGHPLVVAVGIHLQRQDRHWTSGHVVKPYACIAHSRHLGNLGRTAAVAPTPAVEVAIRVLLKGHLAVDGFHRFPEQVSGGLEGTALVHEGVRQCEAGAELDVAAVCDGRAHAESRWCGPVLGGVLCGRAVQHL